ncbi:MAG: HD domain-containing protein [Bacilli bacterium]|nr:HD domain-containing protein [Bacilli bacterium]
MTKNEKIAKENFLKKEMFLSEYATKSSEAVRLKEEDEKEDIRTPFFRDIDRIIHSLSYTRYMDKTQVFTHNQNDHVSKRITHVQMVSKIARTIGRGLNLNEDLIEAIALGHDIGHTPLGHMGESLLNEISLQELNEYFAHNIQSVRHLNFVEKNGKGLNLCIQVLDGIMCHNGEILRPIYEPQKKDVHEVVLEYEMAYKDLKKANQNRPMTLEGCVVRISDVIGYIGRDIEDAIMIGKIKREEIPKNIVSVLGCTNKDIINTIILDIINHSMGKPYIKLSEDVYQALFDLKEFNYEHIYRYSMTEKEKDHYKKGMNKIYKRYLEDINQENHESVIYRFIEEQDSSYLESTSPQRIVIDFIAGMTDEMFLREISL